MHAIEEITPHEAVAAPLEDIETSASGHRHGGFAIYRVEQALEEAFPVAEFVNFIESNLWFW